MVCNSSSVPLRSSSTSCCRFDMSPRTAIAAVSLYVFLRILERSSLPPRRNMGWRNSHERFLGSRSSRWLLLRKP